MNKFNHNNEFESEEKVKESKQVEQAASTPDRAYDPIQEEKDRHLAEEYRQKVDRMREFKLSGDLVSDTQQLLALTGQDRILNIKVEGSEDPRELLSAVAAIRKAISDTLYVPKASELNIEAKRLFFVDIPLESIRQFDKVISNYGRQLPKVAAPEVKPTSSLTSEGLTSEGQGIKFEKKSEQLEVFQRAYSKAKSEFFQMTAQCNQLKELRIRAGLDYMDNGHRPDGLKNYVELSKRVITIERQAADLLIQQSQIAGEIVALSSDESLGHNLQEAELKMGELLQDYIVHNPETAKYMLPERPEWPNLVDQLVKGQQKMDKLLEAFPASSKTVN